MFPNFILLLTCMYCFTWLCYGANDEGISLLKASPRATAAAVAHGPSGFSSYQSLPAGAVLVPVAGGGVGATSYQIFVPTGNGSMGISSAFSSHSGGSSTPLATAASALPMPKAQPRANYTLDIISIMHNSSYREQYYNVIYPLNPDLIRGFSIIEQTLRLSGASPTLLDQLRPIALEVIL